MSTSSLPDPIPDQSPPKPRRDSRDGGFSVWHSTTADTWEARVAVGVNVLDLTRGLSVYLPGGVRLVDARPDDGSGMLTLVFEPDRKLAADRADLAADLETALNLEAGLAAILSRKPGDEA